ADAQYVQVRADRLKSRLDASEQFVLRAGDHARERADRETSIAHLRERQSDCIDAINAVALDDPDGSNVYWQPVDLRVVDEPPSVGQVLLYAAIQLSEIARTQQWHVEVTDTCGHSRVLNHLELPTKHVCRVGGAACAVILEGAAVDDERRWRRRPAADVPDEV